MAARQQDDREDDGPSRTAETGDPYRHLALAVLMLAIRDGQAGSAGMRAEVARFVDSPMFAFWCQVADVDPAGVRQGLGARREP